MTRSTLFEILWKITLALEEKGCKELDWTELVIILFHGRFSYWQCGTFMFCYNTWFSIQLKPLTTWWGVAVTATLQTLDLPKILGCHSDAYVDSSLLGYDCVDWFEWTNLWEKLNAFLRFISNASVQPTYLYWLAEWALLIENTHSSAK